MRFGQGLKHALGWRRGDVLALYAPNDVDTPVVNLGLHWAGGVASPANPAYTPGELARQLADSGARALVTTPALLGPARDAARRAGMRPCDILLLGADADAVPAPGPGSGPGPGPAADRPRHWTALSAAGAAVPPAKTPVDPARDLAFLVYSSVRPSPPPQRLSACPPPSLTPSPLFFPPPQGTTGLPKGVMLTHHNVVANTLQTFKADGRTLSWDLDCQVGILPFFHIYVRGPLFPPCGTPGLAGSRPRRASASSSTRP